MNYDIPVLNQRVPLSQVAKMIREFEPYKNLWVTTADWQKWQESWMNEPLNKIDPESLEQNISVSYKTMHKCIKYFKDNPGCLSVAQEVSPYYIGFFN